MPRWPLIVGLTGLLALSLGALSACQTGATETTTIGTGTLHVLVRGADGQPLAGAKVVSNTQPEGQLKVTGLTAKDGTVTFRDIRAGQYEFYVSGTDYEQADFTVVVSAGRTEDFTIALMRRPPPSNASQP